VEFASLECGGQKDFAERLTIPWFKIEADEVSEQQIKRCGQSAWAEARERISGKLKRVLLLPPDRTRAPSGAGKVTEWATETKLNSSSRIDWAQARPTL
jgi:hypothetical protein